MSSILDESTRLHRAVARYRVTISRRTPAKLVVEVATDLPHDEALALEQKLSAQLGREEPHLAGRMCRSLALRELTNGPEIARILGYGPSFCLERAQAAVAKLEGVVRTPAMP